MHNTLQNFNTLWSDPAFKYYTSQAHKGHLLKDKLGFFYSYLSVTIKFFPSAMSATDLDT